MSRRRFLDGEQLIVVHKGQELRYSENDDVWRCYELDIEAPTLGKLKAKVQAWEAAKRRVGRVPVLYLEHMGGGFEEVDATLLDEDGTSIWINRAADARYHKGAKERVKTSLDRIIPDTPENRAQLAQLAELYRIAKEADASARAARDTLPRADLAYFARLSFPPEELAGKARGRR